MNARTPGNVMHNKTSQPRTIMMGSAEAAQAAQIALMKEDLYSDLTGLILRGVERGEEADIYDCIQTGRNGSKYPSYCHPREIQNLFLFFCVALIQAELGMNQLSTSNSRSPTT